MNLLDLALVIVVCLVWSFNFVAGASAMQHFPPLLFMALRFVVVLAIALPFLRLPPPGQWLRLVSVCLLIGCAHFSIMFWALARSGDVSSVAVLQQTYIPIAVLLAMLLLGEKLGWRSMLAVVVAFTGVLVIGFDPLVLRQMDVLGLVLLSAFFQALGSVYMRAIHGIRVLNFQAWTALICLPALFALSMLLEQDQLEVISSAAGIHWASLLYSALVASLVGHGLFFYLVQRHRVVSIMPWMLLTPVFAVLFGVSVWGDRPGWRLLLGSALVLAGILAITLRARVKSTVVTGFPE